MAVIHFITNGTNKNSDRCRGVDIAHRLNFPIHKINDIDFTKINQQDLIISIKCYPNKPNIPSNQTYIDLVDSADEHLIKILKNNPEINALVQTPFNRIYLQDKFNLKNKIYPIRHCHCNNEKLKRFDDPFIKNKIPILLYNGHPSGFENSLEFKRKADKWGFKFKMVHTCNQYSGEKARKEAIKLYREADIFLAFRTKPKRAGLPLKMKGPTKLNNAGSFGLPCVAYPEPAFATNFDKPGNFLRAKSFEDMIGWCMELKANADMYYQLGRMAYIDSTAFHIDNVINEYVELLK